MSYWPENGKATPPLRSAEGELVVVRVRVSSRLLEDLLDVLSRLDFPINPEIRHGYPETMVEFPAYTTHAEKIEDVLRISGLASVKVEMADMLQAIA